MKINIYTNKKLQEADEIQNGDGESNASQDTNINTVDQTQIKIQIQLNFHNNLLHLSIERLN